MRRRLDDVVVLLVPAGLVLAVAALGSQLGAVRQLEFDDALVATAIVVSLYVFVGNSGVISFGQISFVAIGAYLSGILTLGAEQKQFILPQMYGFLRNTHTSTTFSLWTIRCCSSVSVATIFFVFASMISPVDGHTWRPSRLHVIQPG